MAMNCDCAGFVFVIDNRELCTFTRRPGTGNVPVEHFKFPRPRFLSITFI